MKKQHKTVTNLAFYTGENTLQKMREGNFQITKTERIVASRSTIEEIPKTFSCQRIVFPDNVIEVQEFIIYVQGKIYDSYSKNDSKGNKWN